MLRRVKVGTRDEWAFNPFCISVVSVSMCVGAIIGVWRRSEDSLVESALSSCLPWFSAVQLRSSGLRVNFYPQCSQALEPIFF